MKIVIEFEKDPTQRYEVAEATFDKMNRDFRGGDAVEHYDLLPRGTVAINWHRVTAIREDDDGAPVAFERRVERQRQEYM